MPVYCTDTFPLRQNLSNPPYGERGVGASVARAARWGRIENYMAQVNDSLCLLVQEESKTALDNLDEILDVEGIDGVFIGPANLSASLGYPDNAGHPEVQRIIETSIRRIRAAGKAAGFLAVAPDMAQQCRRGERTLSLLALTRCSTAMPWINDWRCLNQAKMGHA